MGEKLRPAAGWAKFNEHPPGVCVLHVIFTLRVGLYMIRTHAFPPYDALEPRRLAREQGTAGRLDWPAANLATHPARGQPTTQAATISGSPMTTEMQRPMVAAISVVLLLLGCPARGSCYPGGPRQDGRNEPVPDAGLSSLRSHMAKDRFFHLGSRSIGRRESRGQGHRLGASLCQLPSLGPATTTQLEPRVWSSRAVRYHHRRP